MAKINVRDRKKKGATEQSKAAAWNATFREKFPDWKGPVLPCFFIDSEVDVDDTEGEYEPAEIEHTVQTLRRIMQMMEDLEPFECDDIQAVKTKSVQMQEQMDKLKDMLKEKDRLEGDLKEAAQREAQLKLQLEQMMRSAAAGGRVVPAGQQVEVQNAADAVAQRQEAFIRAQTQVEHFTGGGDGAEEKARQQADALRQAERERALREQEEKARQQAEATVKEQAGVLQAERLQAGKTADALQANQAELAAERARAAEAEAQRADLERQVGALRSQQQAQEAPAASEQAAREQQAQEAARRAAAADRAATDKAAAEKAEKAAAERAAAEKAAAETKARAAAEKAAAEKAEKAAAERAAAEKAEKATAERAAAEKAAAERAEKAAAERAAAEKAEKAAAERAAAEKAAAEKAAADKKAAADRTTQPDDRRALNAVFRAMGGPNWKNKAGWTTSEPLGTC
jgi:hypothetical protein